jgi:hypothetical protein
MLALDDAALARIVIGATRVRASKRSRWLQDVIIDFPLDNKRGGPATPMSAATVKAFTNSPTNKAPRSRKSAE